MTLYSKLAISVAVLAFVGTSGIYLPAPGPQKAAEPKSNAARYQNRVLYANTQGDTGVSFDRRMGIGRIDNTPGLDPLRMQGWSEPIADCSNREFRCISAGNFIIFTPVAAPLPRRTYRYLGRYLRVIDCAGNERLCTLEIGKDRQPRPQAPETAPLLVYLAQSDRGVLSLGFSEVPDDPHVVSQQYRLRGPVGLFGSQ